MTEHFGHLFLAASPLFIAVSLLFFRLKWGSFKWVAVISLLLFFVSTAVPIHTLHSHSPLQTSDCCLVLPSIATPIVSLDFLPLHSLPFTPFYRLNPEAVYFIPSQNRSPPLV